MKLNIQTKVMIRSQIRLLVQILEMGNNVDDKQALLIIPKVKSQERNKKGITDALNNGNYWMAIYFLRELLEQVLLSDDF
jgi:hypothetical protein